MNYYYSGQGSFYMGARSALGKPAGLFAIGNVPDLSIDIETTEFSHKESETGQRLEDLIITQEKTGSFSFTMESVNQDNLAVALWGETANVTGSTVTDEVQKLYVGKRTPVNFPDISAVTVESKDGDEAPDWTLTTAKVLGDYVVPTTPNQHYYKVTTAGTTAGTEPTWPTDGTTVVDGTVTWTDMGLIIKVANTDYIVDGKNGVIAVPETGSSVDEGGNYNIAYTYAASKKLDALTAVAAPERYLRFEGLNTVDESRVIVDIFRGRFAPLTGYALINEEITQPEVTGSILADSLQTSGSKFFRQWNVSA